MATQIDEVKDLTTCCICFHEYDEDAHTPKYLNCHHTFCIECIRKLSRVNEIICPKCRKKTVKSVDNLTINVYALHMATSSANNNPAAQPRLVTHEGRWCTSCKREALPSCMKDHSTFSMGPKSAEFCLHLLQSKDLYEAQINSIFEKRQAAKTYLHEVSTAHSLVGEAIRRLEDENNVHFALTNSLLENFDIIKEDETAQSLSLKLEETRDLIKEELVDVQTLEKKYLQHINGETKITFTCHREGKEVASTMPFYTQKSDVGSRMLKAATHVLLSLLKIDENINPEDAARLSPSTSGAFNIRSGLVNRMIPVMPSIKVENAVFAMNFQQSSGRFTTVNYGTVLIKPSTAFYGPPSGSFGQFSLTTPPFGLYGTSIDKALSGRFVSFQGILHLIQALFPNSAKILSQVVVGGPSDPLDVNLVDYIVEGNVQLNNIAGFEMTFFGHSKLNLMCRKRCVHFGKIVDGEKTVQTLSRLANAERSGFSIHIEYRCV